MNERYLLQPFRFGAREDGSIPERRNGVALTEDPDRHLRDKILAVLFTRPGERVNQPRFGVGIDRAVFEPLDELTLGALEFHVSQGLRRDLGGEVIVERVDLIANPEAGELLLQIGYQRRSDRVPRNLEIVL